MNCMSDCYELAMVLVGLDHNKENLFEDEISVQELLYEKFKIVEFEGLQALIEQLAPLIQIGENPFSKKKVKGFAVDGAWLYQREIED